MKNFFSHAVIATFILATLPVPSMAANPGANPGTPSNPANTNVTLTPPGTATPSTTQQWNRNSQPSNFMNSTPSTPNQPSDTAPNSVTNPGSSGTRNSSNTVVSPGPGGNTSGTTPGNAGMIGGQTGARP